MAVLKKIRVSLNASSLRQLGLTEGVEAYKQEQQEEIQSGDSPGGHWRCRGGP